MQTVQLLSEHIVEQYYQQYGADLRIKEWQPLGGGCINNAYKIETAEGPLFLKWNASGPDDLFLREFESLAEFQKSNISDITFPQPLLAREIDHVPGYLLTTYLEPGKAGDDDEKLGRGLAQLHQLSNEQYGFQTNNYCGATLQNNSFKNSWLEFYSENRIAYLVRLIQHNRNWEKEDNRLLERFMARIPDLLDHPVQPALIHGDLWSGNYMYTTNGPALIDPCASYCDREFEMGIMTMFGGFSSRVYAAYNEYYPLEKGWKERNLIYRLYHILNHYYLFGGAYKLQALDVMRRYI